VTDLTSQSPAEIDAQIFALLQTQWAAEDKQAWLTEQAHSLAGDSKSYGWGRGERQGTWRLTDVEALGKVQYFASTEGTDYHATQARKLIDEFGQTMTAISTAHSARLPLEAEYLRRGRWTRAYLVDNADGHVHNTTTCATWNKGWSATRYHWLTELSGNAESEIVELAGERACTVCYPSAPVDVLKRPSKLEGPVQQAAREAKQAKAAKKAAADAEAIVVEGIAEIGDRETTKTFKTVRAATNFIAGELSSLTWYGMTHPSAQRWETNVKRIRAALEAKGVDYDYDKALANARKKTNRDNSGGAKY
jgi:hypothetical protein